MLFASSIQEGFSKSFYDEIISFMRNFFSGAFKDNSNITYGFLTGILRIAQESIFSGLNNLIVNSVMDEEYDEFFALVKEKVVPVINHLKNTTRPEILSLAYDIEKQKEFKKTY